MLAHLIIIVEDAYPKLIILKIIIINPQESCKLMKLIIKII